MFTKKVSNIIGMFLQVIANRILINFSAADSPAKVLMLIKMNQFRRKLKSKLEN